MFSYSTPEDSNLIPNLSSPPSQGSIKTPGWAAGCFKRRLQGYPQVSALPSGLDCRQRERLHLSLIISFLKVSLYRLMLIMSWRDTLKENKLKALTEEQGVSSCCGAIPARVDINPDEAVRNLVNTVSNGEEKL